MSSTFQPRTGVAALFLRNAPFPCIVGNKNPYLQSEGLNNAKIIGRGKKIEGRHT